MPNWCENQIILETDNRELYDKIKGHLEYLEENQEEEQRLGLFGLLYPEPDYNKVDVKKYGDPNEVVKDKSQAWWDWRVVNWGTKWDIYHTGHTVTETEFNEYEDDDGNKQYQIFIWADTAWSPPISWAREVEQRHNLDITVKYYEGGVGFCGIYETGVGDREFDLDDLESIPEDIKDEFALNEVYAKEGQA